MNMRLLLLAAVMTWHVASSAIVSRDVHNGTEAVVEAVVSELCEGEQSEPVITFSDRSFKAIAEDATGNLVYSPISLIGTLSIASLGAAGDTEKQLQSAIEHPYATAPERELESTEKSSEESTKIELSIAYKIFLAEGFTASLEFLDVVSWWFQSELQSVNFDKPVEASKTINEWSAAHTSNRIRDLVRPADLNGTTSLVLVNMVCFKGDWVNKFNEKETTMRPFYVNGTTVRNVPTMHRVDNYRYGELPEVKAKFIELPYKTNGETDQVSMFIILPDKVDGLSELIGNFEKVTIQKLYEGKESNVELFLPKFKIESTIDLEAPLGKLGLADIFGNSANFSGITDKAPLKIGKFVQVNFISVDEQGTETASATESQIESRMLHNVTFLVDHPFASVIVTEVGIPVFTTVIVDPITEF